MHRDFSKQRVRKQTAMCTLNILKKRQSIQDNNVRTKSPHVDYGVFSFFL